MTISKSKIFFIHSKFLGWMVNNLKIPSLSENQKGNHNYPLSIIHYQSPITQSDFRPNNPDQQPQRNPRKQQPRHKTTSQNNLQNLVRLPSDLFKRQTKKPPIHRRFPKILSGLLDFPPIFFIHKILYFRI
jgi:hypothetical protein